MKKLKNNKGITGVDITASIVVIAIAVGVISVMYAKYISNTKQVKRNTEANNLATKFIQYIERTNYDIIDELFDTNNDGVDENNDGVDENNEIKIEAEEDIVNRLSAEALEIINEIPLGYTVSLKKEEEIEKIAMKIKIEVSYTLDSENKKISLGTIKTKTINQTNLPNMEAEQVKDLSKNGCKKYILKYSNKKQGYVQGKISDNEWYTVSNKTYPIVGYAKENDFDVNGVINLEKCTEIYVWVPKFGMVDEENYGFCYDTTDNMIVYGDTGTSVSDTVNNQEYSIIGYSVDTSKTLTNIPVEFTDLTGKWVKVDSNLNPIDDSGEENNILNILKTKQFKWN